MTLARFVVRRAAGGVVFALVVASLTLLLARIAPGDATTDEAVLMTPAERAARRAELGLDAPLHSSCPVFCVYGSCESSV